MKFLTKAFCVFLFVSTIASAAKDPYDLPFMRLVEKAEAGDKKAQLLVGSMYDNVCFPGKNGHALSVMVEG